MLVIAASSALQDGPASQVRSRLSGMDDQRTSSCRTAAQCETLGAQHKSFLHQDAGSPVASSLDGSITGSWSCRKSDSCSIKSANSLNTGITFSQVKVHYLPAIDRDSTAAHVRSHAIANTIFTLQMPQCMQVDAAVAAATEAEEECRRLRLCDTLRQACWAPRPATPPLPRARPLVGMHADPRLLCLVHAHTQAGRLARQVIRHEGIVDMLGTVTR